MSVYHKHNISTSDFTQFIISQHLHIYKIHKNEVLTYTDLNNLIHVKRNNLICLKGNQAGTL